MLVDIYNEFKFYLRSGGVVVTDHDTFYEFFETLDEAYETIIDE